MDVRVLKTFRDKYTKEIYLPGQVIKLTKKRVAEVEENLPGYIEIITDEPEISSDSR